MTNSDIQGFGAGHYEALRDQGILIELPGYGVQRPMREVGFQRVDD